MPPFCPSSPRRASASISAPSLSADGAQSWLALDDRGSPLTNRTLIRDAASIAALVEIAEESAAIPTRRRAAARVARISRFPRGRGRERRRRRRAAERASRDRRAHSRSRAELQARARVVGGRRAPHEPLPPRRTEAVDQHAEDEDAEPHGEQSNREHPAVVVQAVAQVVQQRARSSRARRTRPTSHGGSGRRRSPSAPPR